MLRKKLALWTLCLLSLLLFSTTTEAIDPLKFNVTSDNAYRFGFGKLWGIPGIYNKYWFDYEWNNTANQIKAAETYPKSTASNNQFPSLFHDYFYVACFGGTKKTPYVDVVVVIDESGSMQNEQQFTKTLITNLETKLNVVGIGSGGAGANRYGLVGFGGKAPHQLGHPHLVGVSNMPQLFGTAVQYCTAVTGLVDNGWQEDGYSGINLAISYPWRSDAARIIILITDEDRDEVNTALTDVTTLNNLNSNKITLNVIITCDISSGNTPAMAIDANNTAYVAVQPSGSFTASLNGSIANASGSGTSIQDYASLAFATNGLVGDFDSIKNLTGSAYSNALAASFSNALAGNITGQATIKNPYRGMIAEVIATNSLEQPPFALQAAKWEVYATGVAGDTDGDWSATNAPTWQQINAQIKLANDVIGTQGTSSQGWVNVDGEVVNGAGIPQTSNGFPVNSRGKLVTGEDNSTGGPYFDVVSPMDQQTRWMWYNPNPGIVTKPFETGLESDGKNDGAREFLIFRLPIKNLPPPCCDDCCDEKFKVSFSPNHKVKLDPTTGRLDLSHFFSVDVKGPPAREIAKVNATLISSWKTCNGQQQSLGMHFWQPPPPPPGGPLNQALSNVFGWDSNLTSPPFSHELTWERTTAQDSWFSLNNPLALTIPVSELKCAETIGFCIKYTFIDSNCQVCEEVVKCYEYSLRPGDTRRSTLEEGKPTLAPPEVPRDDTPRDDTPKTTPSTTGPSRTGPSRTGPSRTNPARTNPSRTSPSRTNPGRTDRPTIRRPLDVRPVDPQRGADRPVDLEKDPRKPVVEQPADGKDVPQKSDREKPAVKKPAERKEAEAKRVADEPANRSVLLKK